MNYLAHLYYAGEDKESILGNFLGDFVKGKITSTSFSEKVQAGIALHRSIDKKADNRIISLLDNKAADFNHRRYAGITFDLACDHFLAKNWHHFHEDAIELFSLEKIDILKNQETHLPEKGKLVLERMIQYQWLDNYQSLDFLEQVFVGIHKRFPRDNQINLAFLDLKNNYLNLEESCLDFMKQLQIDLLSDK